MEPMKLKETMDAQEFALWLRECADAVEQGKTVQFMLSGQVFTVQPTGKFSVKYEAEEDKEELEFDMSWRAAA